VTDTPRPGPDDRADGEYFQQIEAWFGQLRGAPLLLSPRDVALVDAWWRAGIPLRVVLSAIESVFERRRDAAGGSAALTASGVHSLAYCRHAVEAAFEDWKELQIGGRPESEETRENVRAQAGDFLRGRAAELESLALASAAPRAELLRNAGGRLRELAARLDGTEAPGLGNAETELESLEDDLLDALLEGMEPAERQELADEAHRDLDPLRARLTQRAYETSLQSATRARLRERLNLPRLTLYLL
jgi:hypothetical protein